MTNPNSAPTTTMDRAASVVQAKPPQVMGLADVTLFMVTAGCSLQWTATAAATGPSSLIVWLFGVIGMFLPISVSVVFLSAAYPEEDGLCSPAIEASESCALQESEGK
jgi:hypothetical protein